MFENNRTFERLKHYDKIFGTKTKENINSLPLIRIFYEYFKERILTPEDKDKEIIDTRNNKLKELEETFSGEQLKLFKEYKEASDTINDNLSKQAFIFGYITFAEFYLEAEQCINKDEIKKKKE